VCSDVGSELELGLVDLGLDLAVVETGRRGRVRCPVGIRPRGEQLELGIRIEVVKVGLGGLVAGAPLVEEIAGSLEAGLGVVRAELEPEWLVEGLLNLLFERVLQ